MVEGFAPVPMGEKPQQALIRLEPGNKHSLENYIFLTHSHSL